MTSACDIATRHCKPCEGGIPPLSPEAARELMQTLHARWQLAPDGRSISRMFEFRNYYETIAFVNAVAWIANAEDHHPDLDVHYSRCIVGWRTHAVDGLTENDFICAARIDRLVE